MKAAFVTCYFFLGGVLFVVWRFKSECLLFRKLEEDII